MLAEDKFDGEIGGKHGYDGVASLTAGLTYRFPARGFARPMPQIISEIELANMPTSSCRMHWWLHRTSRWQKLPNK